MWAVILIVLILAVVVAGIAEVFSGERRPILMAIGVGALLFLGKDAYEWQVTDEVLLFVTLAIVGAVRFFEK